MTQVEEKPEQIVFNISMKNDNWTRECAIHTIGAKNLYVLLGHIQMAQRELIETIIALENKNNTT